MKTDAGPRRGCAQAEPRRRRGGDHGNRAEGASSGRVALLLGEEAAGQGHDRADDHRAEPRQDGLVADGAPASTMALVGWVGSAVTHLGERSRAHLDVRGVGCRAHGADGGAHDGGQ